MLDAGHEIIKLFEWLANLAVLILGAMFGWMYKRTDRLDNELQQFKLEAHREFSSKDEIANLAKKLDIMNENLVQVRIALQDKADRNS